jgi:hypothetical protein
MDVIRVVFDGMGRLEVFFGIVDVIRVVTIIVAES